MQNTEQIDESHIDIKPVFLLGFETDESAEENILLNHLPTGIQFSYLSIIYENYKV